MNISEFWFTVGKLAGLLHNENILATLRLNGYTQEQIQELKTTLMDLAKVAYQ
jgi:hypothetical protein